MNASAESAVQRAAFRGLRAPLNLAAYLTWLALAWTPVQRAWSGALPLDLRSLAGGAGSLAVLLLLLARERTDTGVAGQRRRRALIVAQIPGAWLACWGLGEGAQPILLVVVAAQLAVAFRPRATLAWLLVANLGLLVILLERFRVDDVLVSMISMAGFQLFAALSAGYAHAAELARDEALQAHAELHAAQLLLDEGARGDERLRLSRELHDVVGHKLTALKLQLALAERRADDAGRASLTACRELADAVLGEVRAVVGQLRQHDGIDLQQAIAAQLAPLAALGPRMDVRIDPALRIADLQRAHALLRVTQEAVTNVLRHAGARHLQIALTSVADTARLTVEDDGRGLRGAPEGYGIAGMRERLAAFGGSLELRERAGGGTRLCAAIPL
ncbi:sensor histidine kinase [Solimonas terrae]|uniref:Sensor histidine kinase n=1 Tax=Solimonas terrae TaxID=1396819 RepID=A0A6M2BV27_9GAMM|nr:histidine kinase [Solimonas terrae]NGY06512.1 sensor histidine kinase [Solimonas terrae]